MAVWHVTASMAAAMLAEKILWCDVMTMLLCDVNKLITVSANHLLQLLICVCLIKIASWKFTKHSQPQHQSDRV